MDSRLFLFLTAVVGLAAAALLGVTIGGGDYYIVLGLFGGMVLFLLLFVFFPSYLPEAKILVFLICGYIIFQRLFAELRALRFIFVGEIGLATCAVLVLIRTAFKRGRLIPIHPLTWPILGFLLFGVARFAMVDFKQYGLLAARDFAVVYYMAFYFVGYSVGTDETSRRFVRRALYAATAFYIAMVLVLAVVSRFGVFAWAAGVLSTRDMAIIVPTYATLLLGVAFVQYRRPILFLLAFVPLAWMLYLRARSGYVAFGVSVFFFLAAISASRSAFVTRLLVLVFATAVLGSTMYIASELARVETVQPFVTEVQDIFDAGAFKERKSVSAHGGSTQGYSHETSRWRTAWWQAVYDDVIATNPVFGLGFGYDLARRFNREYYGRTGGEAAARNPHNVAFTFLGRMGLVGLGLFVWFCVVFLRHIGRVISAVRNKRQPLENVNLCLVNLVMLLVALFSHTFEGPMAAIPFWSLLGVSVAEQVAAAAKTRTASRERVRQKFQRELVPAG